jgi:hypothetical protein
VLPDPGAAAVRGPDQLWLLEPPRPLAQRFGEDFFASIPRRPGVYLMTGRPRPGGDSRVLYVGKAIDLRRRLQSYKNLRPGLAGRRLSRLALRVEQIAWELCADEEEALLRENELLRRHRPLFNRANTWPAGYWYVVVGGDDTRLDLRLTHEPGGRAGAIHGAFKSAGGYAALLRLLAALGCGGRPGARPPGRLFRDPPLSRAAFGRPAGWAGADFGVLRELVCAFFAGESARLIERLERGLPSGDGCSLFQRRWQGADLEEMRAFYAAGPARNARLRLGFDLAAAPIPAAELDDLLVLAAGRGEPRVSCRRGP